MKIDIQTICKIYEVLKFNLEQFSQHLHFLNIKKKEDQKLKVEQVLENWNLNYFQL